jgi:hypothetical protein
MPIPNRHRDFFIQLGKLSCDDDGCEVLVGLSVEETEDWLRLAFDRDLRASVRFYDLNARHDTAIRMRAGGRCDHPCLPGPQPLA